jgi:hypothetical protein
MKMIWNQNNKPSKQGGVIFTPLKLSMYGSPDVLYGVGEIKEGDKGDFVNRRPVMVH